MFYLPPVRGYLVFILDEVLQVTIQSLGNTMQKYVDVKHWSQHWNNTTNAKSTLLGQLTAATMLAVLGQRR